MSDSEKIIFQIGADSQGFRDALSLASAAVDGLAQALENAFDQSDPLGSLSDAAEDLVPPFDETWRRIYAMRFDTENELRQMALQEEFAALQHSVNMGEMKYGQLLEMERAFIDQQMSLKEEAARFDYDNSEQTAEDYERLKARLLLIDAEHNRAIADNARDLALEQKRYWQLLSDSIRASMEDAFVGLANGTMSWGEATQGILNSVLQSFIKMAAQEFAQLVSLENLKSIFKKKKAAEGVATEAQAGAQKKAIHLANATTEITADAATASAGAYKALVGIPVIGPILAPAAAAVAMGAVMALIGKLSSAAGGWGQVPHDQLAMIHKDEMVLPAKYANPLRDQLEGGELGDQGGNFNISINAIDGPSVERFFKGNGAALVRAMKAQTRNFAFQA
jgi:hypothetical protein